MRIKILFVALLCGFNFTAFGLPECNYPTEWQDILKDSKFAVIALGDESALVSEVPKGDCTAMKASQEESKMLNPLGFAVGLGRWPDLCAATAERNGFRCYQTAYTNHVFPQNDGKGETLVPTTECFACK